MKKLNLTLVLIVLSFICSQAQSNSVVLKDGAGNVINSFSSIQLAYNAIPATLTQAYTIEVNTTYDATDETFPITFINKAGASAANTITLMPYTVVTAFIEIAVGADTSSAILLDNADWIVVKSQTSPVSGSFRFVNYAQTRTFPLIHLVNGASNNTIRKCGFQDYGEEGSLSGILIGESITEPSGNSYNSIDTCSFTLCNYGVELSGSPVNRNTQNSIHSSSFVTRVAGVWQHSVGGPLTIDSNIMQQISIFSDNHCVLIEDLDDSVFITNNKLKIYGGGEYHSIKAISIGNSAGNTGYASVVNNFIPFDEAQNLLVDTEDSMTYVLAMEFAGDGDIAADVFFNTVRIRGRLAGGGVPGDLGSSAFYKTSTGTGGVYNIQNNLFLSERVDSFSGMQHLAVSIPETAGSITINNNTYNVPASDLAHYSGVTYSNLSDYQAAIGGGNETNSNIVSVEFESVSDWRLYNTAVNNPGLQGVPIASVTRDLEGDARSYPYRGCDEYEVTCADDIPMGNVQMQAAPVCYGTTIYIQYFSLAFGNGHYYRWQSRPMGSVLPFTDIPGFIHTIEFPTMYESTEFRVVDSCADGAPVVISNVGVIYVNPLPSVTGITETHTSYTYDFVAVGTMDVTGYEWDFGDGSATDTAASPQHTYNDDGTYTVTLIVINNCGRDTVTLDVPVSVEDWEKENVHVKIYPNPTSDMVHIESKASPISAISVYTAAGAEVIQATFSNMSEADVSTAKLTPGFYLLNITTEKGIVRRPLNVLR